MTSEELARGLREGKNAVLIAISTGPLGQKIRSIALHAKGDIWQAEDLLYATLMKAIMFLRTSGKYKEEGKCEAWLFGIAKNTWREQMKRNNKHTWLSLDQAPEQRDEKTPYDIFESADETLSGAQDRINLLEKINQLDPKCRQLIKLHFLEGYTLKETDQILKLSTNYSNVLKPRCLEKLRRLFDTAS